MMSSFCLPCHGEWNIPSGVIQCKLFESILGNNVKRKGVSTLQWCKVQSVGKNAGCILTSSIDHFILVEFALVAVLYLCYLWEVRTKQLLYTV